MLFLNLVLKCCLTICLRKNCLELVSLTWLFQAITLTKWIFFTFSSAFVCFLSSFFLVLQFCMFTGNADQVIRAFYLQSYNVSFCHSGEASFGLSSFILIYTPHVHHHIPAISQQIERCFFPSAFVWEPMGLPHLSK